MRTSIITGRKATYRQRNAIIYNTIYGVSSSQFTISELIEYLKQAGLDLSADEVIKEVERYIQAGLIRRNFSSFTVRSR